MEPGRFFMKFAHGRNFVDNVRDKFQKVIPENLYEEKDLNRTLRDLNISSLVPKLKDDGSYDKRYTKAIEYLIGSQCIPACANPHLSPSQLDSISSGSRDAPAKLNLRKRFTKTVVASYHEDQLELCKLLWTEDYANSIGKATTEEFAEAFDRESISVMTEYHNFTPLPNGSFSDIDVEDITSKIDQCFKVLVSRLCIHMDAENDLMTETGWMNWRHHAYVVSSFAVYYISLQLCRVKMAGTYRTL